MEYEVQTARITTTGKLTDRFLNCQTKTATDLAQAYMGTIYSLVEIVSPWFSTTQVGQTIINAFSQNYYHGGSTSDLTNFEASLKNVNEALAQITQNGETNWIGNLNAILAVVVENKIHLAQTGRAEAYIFREGKTNHLTYGLAQSQIETHPLKTFSNVTSGELKNMDKVLIANPDLFSTIDIETLREIITLHHPNEAILQIAKILKKKKIKTVNCLILNLLSLEEASRRADTNLVDNIHLDRPIESLWVVLEKFWQQFLKPFFHFTGTQAKKVSAHSWQFTKNYLEKMKDRKNSEIPRKKDLFDKEFLSEVEDNGLLKDEEIQYSPELNIHHYEQELAAKHDPWRLAKIAAAKTGQVLSIIFGWLWQMLKQKKTRPYFLIALAIIIVVIIGFNISASRHNGRQKVTLLEAQNILKTTETAQKDARAAILSGDQAKATTLYADCVQKSQNIISVEVVKAPAQETLTACAIELDKLTATTRFDKLTPITTGEKDTKTMFVVAGQVFLSTKDTIYKGTTNGGAMTKVATLPRNNGDFQFGIFDGANIDFYTSAKKVYQFKIDTGKLELVKTDGLWETANAAAYYMGNLYLLDGIIGQIYRHSSNASSFSVGTNYVTSASIDLKNGLSVAIDGSVFVLLNSGEVLELQKGKLQDFSLKDIPAPWSKIEKPVKIYTDADTTSLYILDAGAKRVLEFDKNGEFVHQYALPGNLNNLTDFTVSSKAKKIWLLNDNQVFEISI